MEELDNELQVLEVEYKIESLIEMYQRSTTVEEKEVFQLELMNYNVDVEAVIVDLQTLKKKNRKLSSSIKDKTLQRKRFAQKIAKTQNAFSEIRLLDIMKMKEVYIPLIENSVHWKNEFWEFLEDNYDVLNNQYTPRRIKEFYQIWKNR